MSVGEGLGEVMIRERTRLKVRGMTRVNVRAKMRLKVTVKVRMQMSVQVRWVPWPLLAVQQPAWSDPETKDSKLPCPS